MSKIISILEACIGCGSEAPKHPWAAVMQSDESTNVLSGGFISKPCCNACHVDPAHRKAKIKAHFFPRAEEKQAVKAAGSSNIGG